MPIYEYACTACGAECEILQRLSDDPERVCPSCGAEALVKQVSAAGFRLKGAGWYETDFKSGNKHNLVSDESSDKSTGTKSDASADKPAKDKSESKSDKPAKSTGVGETKPKAGPASKTPQATPAASGST